MKWPENSPGTRGDGNVTSPGFSSGLAHRIITSRSEAGTAVADMFPSLRGHCDLVFSDPDPAQLGEVDVVFFATPHAVAMDMMASIMATGVKVVDLSADFRIKDVALWEEWYGVSHSCPEWVEEAVYGLPEMNREAIKSASLVACPGCYPTAIQLGFLPLLESGLVDTASLIASASSGVTGAGRQAKLGMLLAEASDNFKTYGTAGHRHLPEMELILSGIASKEVQLTFVPHLIPALRGIHATLYSTLIEQGVDLQALFEKRYADEPFVDVLPRGLYPETRTVRGVNHCRIGIEQPQGRETVVVMAIIDNLVKGASGQAIQNMNLMFGLPETAGLEGIALVP